MVRGCHQAEEGGKTAGRVDRSRRRSARPVREAGRPDRTRPGRSTAALIAALLAVSLAAPVIAGAIPPGAGGPGGS